MSNSDTDTQSDTDDAERRERYRIVSAQEDEIIKRHTRLDAQGTACVDSVDDLIADLVKSGSYIYPGNPYIMRKLKELPVIMTVNEFYQRFKMARRRHFPYRVVEAAQGSDTTTNENLRRSNRKKVPKVTQPSATSKTKSTRTTEPSAKEPPTRYVRCSYIDVSSGLRCKQTTRTVDNIMQHRVRDHFEAQCPKCDMRFLSKYDLGLHICNAPPRVTHSHCTHFPISPDRHDQQRNVSRLRPRVYYSDYNYQLKLAYSNMSPPDLSFNVLTSLQPENVRGVPTGAQSEWIPAQNTRMRIPHSSKS